MFSLTGRVLIPRHRQGDPQPSYGNMAMSAAGPSPDFSFRLAPRALNIPNVYHPKFWTDAPSP